MAARLRARHPRRLAGFSEKVAERGGSCVVAAGNVDDCAMFFHENAEANFGRDETGKGIESPSATSQRSR